MEQGSLTPPHKIEKTGAQMMVTGNSMAELLATGDDFRFAECGRRTLLTRWMHTYVDRVFFAAQETPDLFQTFFEVTHPISPGAAYSRRASSLRHSNRAQSGLRCEVLSGLRA